MVGVLAAGDAAHVRTREPRASGLIGDVRQEFHVVAEVVHLELGELLLADGLDGERYVLEAFVALLRRHHDRLEPGLLGLLCLYDAGAREDHTGDWQRALDGLRERLTHDCPRIFCLNAAVAAIPLVAPSVCQALRNQNCGACGYARRTSPSADSSGPSQGEKCRHWSRPSRKIGCRTCSELAVRTARGFS